MSTGVASAVVGASATSLSKALKGTSQINDCRDDWRSFGYAYHASFSA